jgi:multicomponent Na+:H+ antiporter subunit B
MMLLFSVFLLLRGHNEPGGGFVGGLVASVAFSLVGIGRGPAAMRRSLRVDPRVLAGMGIAVALLAGLWGPVLGTTFLEGHWVQIGGLKLGTPLLFDVGVYLVVIGAVLTMVLALEEDV